MKPLIIYHANCTDGFGAAFAAWRHFREEAEYVPAHYGDCVISDGSMDIRDKNYPVRNRKVIILDFSLPVSEFCELMETASKVIWLDHHLTAINSWCGPDYLQPDRQVFYQNSYLRNNGERVDCNIILNNQRSGAHLAWAFFNIEVTPMMILHIEDRDLWKFKLSGTKAFIEGLRMEKESFEHWNTLLDIDSYQRLIGQGNILLRSMQRRVDKAVNSELRTVELDGVKGLAANVINDISETGHALCMKSETFSLTFFIKGNEAIVSLRSQNVVDVSAMARKRGGGGHKNASGFHMPIGQFFEEIWK